MKVPKYIVAYGVASSVGLTEVKKLLQKNVLTFST